MWRWGARQYSRTLVRKLKPPLLVGDIYSKNPYGNCAFAFGFPLIFRTFDNAAAKAVDSVVEYGILSFGNGSLFFGELDMQFSVLQNAYEYFLIGLTVSEFRFAGELFFRGDRRDPVKARYFAGFGV